MTSALRLINSRRILCVTSFLSASLSLPAAEISPQERAFFENKIRPVLAEQCYKCHSAESKKLKGELQLDSKPGWMAGGESGAIIVPGKPAESLLMSALHYDKFEMPPKKKLPAEVIKDFESWIAMGAPDPRTEAVTRQTKTEKEAFDLAERKEIWSLQPLAKVGLPSVKGDDWVRTDSDRFVLAEIEMKGWSPAAPATRTSWLRRVTYDLTGLPPTPKEVQDFLADQSPEAHEKVVDRLLASNHFGEQWARHWMDLVRYAETKAFEADYPMPNAFHYRDYLIRSFNSDVPYNQMLMEAIAGDLLEPRINSESGINESVIGPGYLYLTDGQHGPPDIHSDEARIFDDMIDVVGKAFLSQTVACARCHDHKFDAITTKDYYSLYGVISSSRIDYANINPPKKQDELHGKLTKQKTEIRKALAGILADDLKSVRTDLSAALAKKAESPQQKRWATALEKKPNAITQSLHALLSAPDEATIATRWKELQSGAKASPNEGAIGGLTRDSFGEWIASGRSFEAKPLPPGDFIVPHEGDQALRIFGGGRPTAGHLSSRFAGALRSPDFTIAGDNVRVRVRGKNVRVSLYVRHYELIGRGPTTGGTTKVLSSDGWVEHSFNTKLWHGERAYMEIQQNGGQINFNWGIGGHAEDAWAMLDTATNNTPLPPLPAPGTAWLIEGAAPKSPALLLHHLAARIESLAVAWGKETLSVAQGDLLEGLHQAGVFDFKIDRSAALQLAVNAHRKLHSEVPHPTYVRSLSDGHGIDEPVYIRGSHKNLSKGSNPRHFLDGINGDPFDEKGSGRMAWARSLVDRDNPLTARVITNRIWHHLFGRGIVASVDDFGHMGDQPSHPELLDHLAQDFIAEGWSMKGTIRKLVLSSTYRMSTQGNAKAIEADPNNIFLQRMPVRRLQAESIRDTVLAVSGQLDPKLFGPSAGGDGGNRRSVYIQLKRRYMPEFLMTFGMPNATETFGRRNITASPTQALAMMNSPFVWKAAEQWSNRITADGEKTFAERVDLVHQQAFGRSATEDELEWARGFLEDHKITDEAAAARNKALWKDLCHTMLNRKELIYVY